MPNLQILIAVIFNSSAHAAAHHGRRFVVAIFSCIAISLYAQGSRMDSWYTPSTQSPVGSTSSLRLHTDFEPVQPDKLASVEALLKSDPLVEIEAVTAESLTGKKMAIAGEQRRYLVRSLHFAAHGEYTVERDQSSLRVHHRSLGFDAPILRQGLVVLLTERPKQVFVSCSMAR